MRRIVVPIFIVAFAGGAAGDPPGPDPEAKSRPAKPTTSAQAADAVLAAAKANDEKALAALESLEEPDPWYVAEDLCARGEYDAAKAFAKAAPRVDVERLPAYVEWRRAHPVDVKVHAAVARADGLNRVEKDFAAALEAVRGVEPQGDDVTSIRLGNVRGWSLSQARRLTEAGASYLAAGEASERIGFLSRAAAGFKMAGYCSWLRNAPRAALPRWEHLLALEERRGSKKGLEAALCNLSLAYQDLGDAGRALPLQERSLALARELHDETGVGTSLLNIGLLHQGLGDLPKALDALESAWEIFREKGPKLSQHEVLFDLGTVHREMGDLAGALALIEKSLGIAEELKDGFSIERATFGIANVRTRMGDYAAALGLYDRALAIDQELGDRSNPVPILMNTGAIHLLLGQPERALPFLERALAVGEAREDPGRQAAALIDIAGANEALGRHEEALALLERARVLARRAGDKMALSHVVSCVASVRFALHAYAEALAGFEEAVGLAVALGNRHEQAAQLLNVAACEHELGRLAESLAHDERSRALSAEIGALPEEIRALAATAMDLHELKREREALAAAKTAVELLPGLVKGLSEEEGASSRAQHADAFEVGVAAAVALGDAAEACFFLESGRAGSLLESLNMRQALRGVALPKALREAEMLARGREAAAVAAWRRASAGSGAAEASARRAEVDLARAGIIEVIERIQREAKAAADVLYPRALPLPAIQARLAGGEALVLYGFGQVRAVALVVTPKDARLVPLGKSADVVAACGALLLGQEPFIAEDRVDAVRDLVWKPLALDGATKRVLVSPDGPLSYVPVSLFDPAREIAYVPSGTTYALLAEDRAKRGSGVLALGDPEYGARPASGRLGAPLREGMELNALPATREEAKAVGDVLLLGRDATRARLEAEIAKRPRWRAVHLACHGHLDPDRPTLSALALSPTETHDGFWTALDVFRAQVPADLVVLSACETGKGKVYRSEGIVGLTRAFMFAGAPRVLASLWKVDDRATRILMEAFYERWKEGGLGASAALREAQSRVRDLEEEVVDPEASRAAGRDVRVRRRPYAAPRYWAGWALWGLPD